MRFKKGQIVFDSKNQFFDITSHVWIGEVEEDCGDGDAGVDVRYYPNQTGRPVLVYTESVKDMERATYEI